MNSGRKTIAYEIWTLGTRDFRNILSLDFTSRAAAESYQECNGLIDWVVLNVAETDNGRRYSSPDLPEGPLSIPVAGTF